MKIGVLVLLYLTIFTPSLAVAEEPAKTFPGIEVLMTPEEFQAAGLDKLTPAERESLNGFLIRYTAEDAPLLLTTDEEVLHAVQEQEIVSVIQQPFKGWSGDTVFRLENGQVWQQRRNGNYAYRGTHPEVVISKNFMGFFRMELVENGKAVQVKRIK
tara:strand:+ start:170940 stop:171410 length:471 start_codon:yes stop_codon:yes gene_type:complete